MVRMKTVQKDDVVDAIIPGVLRDFDLPDIRRASGRPARISALSLAAKSEFSPPTAGSADRKWMSARGT